MPFDPAAAGLPALQNPQPVVNLAQNFANQQAENQMKQAQVASTGLDMQNKQRAMQLSMLSGILNEPDPQKQQELASKIIPIANKINPSFQIDSGIDIPTIRALVQSQVSPEEQAKNQLMQQMYGMKAVSVSKDPATGALIAVNKMTGQIRPLNPAESQAYMQNPMAFEASQQSGIFPNGQNGAFNYPQQAMPQPNQQPQQPIQAQEPAFGGSISQLSANPAKRNLMAKDVQQVLENNNQNDKYLTDAQRNLDDIETNINALNQANYFNPGSLAGRAETEASGVFGGPSAKAAQALDSTTNQLASNINALQYKPGTRGGALQLKTVLESKPMGSKYSETNQQRLNEIRAQVTETQLENKLTNAFVQTNPLGTLNTDNFSVYDLRDALNKKFPLYEKDKFHPQNAQAWEQAIPDAIQHPYDYIGKRNAQTQAQGMLKQPQNTTGMNAPDAAASIFAAKQAVAKGAPADAVKKRLMDAGIDPAQAGL